MPAAAEKLIKATLSGSSTDALALAQAVLAAKALGVALDASDTFKKLKAVLNHDYTVKGAGLLLSAAASLPAPAAEGENAEAGPSPYAPFVEIIEDIIGQAEVAGDLLSVSGVWCGDLSQ